MKNKLLAFISIVVITLTHATTASFAAELNTLSVDEQFIELTKSEETVELVSDATEIINIDEYGISYYIGDDYVVVEDDSYGFSIITYNEDKTIAYVNGNPINIDECSIDSSDLTSEISSSRAASWTFFDNDEYHISVASLVISVGVGVLVGRVPHLKDYASAIVGYFVGEYISGKFPNMYSLSCYEKDYTRIKNEYTTEWKYVYNVYGGTTSSPKQKKAGTWTIYQDRLV